MYSGEQGSEGVGRGKEKRCLLVTIILIPLSNFFHGIQIPRTGDLDKHKEKLWGSQFAVEQWLSPPEYLLGTSREL